MQICPVGAETGGYVALVCESYSEPIHGTVEHQLIAIPSPSSDVILVLNAPIPLAERRV